jgi:hypothetical protein
MNQRRIFTLILLRPDGSNRTWLLTPGRRRGLVLLVVLPLVAIGLLTWLTIWHVERYQRLRERYELLAGREVPMFTPRPASAEAVPGAAPRTAAGEPEAAAALPQAGAPARAVPESVSPSSAPVSVENFSLTRREEGGWRLYAELIKKEGGEPVVRGFYVVLMEDAERPGEFVTMPEMSLQNGQPISPTAGESFAIRRFRPIEAVLDPPEAFRPREVRFFVYNRTGTLLLEQVFPIGGDA